MCTQSKRASHMRSRGERQRREAKGNRIKDKTLKIFMLRKDLAAFNMLFASCPEQSVARLRLAALLILPHLIWRDENQIRSCCCRVWMSRAESDEEENVSRHENELNNTKKTSRWVLSDEVTGWFDTRRSSLPPSMIALSTLVRLVQNFLRTSEIVAVHELTSWIIWRWLDLRASSTRVSYTLQSESGSRFTSPPLGRSLLGGISLSRFAIFSFIWIGKTFRLHPPSFNCFGMKIGGAKHFDLAMMKCTLRCRKAFQVNRPINAHPKLAGENWMKTFRD